MASSSPSKHLWYFTAVFGRLERHGFVIHPGKCVFGLTEITFLGYMVNAEGIQPMSTQVTAIQDSPRPTVFKELLAFLGVIDFYDRFIPAAAQLLHPLYSALVGRPTRTSPVKWSTPMDKVFHDAKTAQASATLLVHPHQDAPMAVTVDASDLAIGGVLKQFTDGLWRPLAFFSCKLQPAQTSYNAFDRELLAAYASIWHFWYFLEGRQFSLFTDHKPLIFALNKVSDAWSARQQRQLSAISEYTMDIRHVAGKDNVVADALSQAAISAISGGIVSLPLRLPNSQIRSTWPPVGQQLRDFNLRTFLLDPITQLYYVMCLLVGHVPSYLSPSAAVFLTLFMASATRAYGQPANW